MGAKSVGQVEECLETLLKPGFFVGVCNKGERLKIKTASKSIWKEKNREIWKDLVCLLMAL